LGAGSDLCSRANLFGGIVVEIATKKPNTISRVVDTTQPEIGEELTKCANDWCLDLANVDYEHIEDVWHGNPKNQSEGCWLMRIRITGRFV